MTVRDTIRFLVEEYENDVLMAERSNDAEPDPSRTVDRIITSFAEAVTSPEAVEAFNKYWRSSGPTGESFHDSIRGGIAAALCVAGVKGKGHD